MALTMTKDLSKFLLDYYVRRVLIFVILYSSRTPGSRQPSPAEEALTRPTTLLDPATHAYHQQHLQHNMFNASMEQQHHNNQLNSYHPLMNHQLQAPHMNGVGGMQLPQVIRYN